jgi:FKBP-type peptidyl-prolyl cis-trans isomerase
MKLFNFFVLMVLGFGVVSMMSCGAGDVSKVKLAKTEIDSVSYGIGVVFASNFPKDKFPDLNIAALAKGFSDARDSSTIIDEKTASAMAQAYVNKIYREAQEKEMADREAEMAAKAEENKTKFAANYKEQQDFIAATKAKAGVTTTATGLMYEVLKKGNGANPTAQDVVKVHYKGTFINGEQFDSSYDRKEPYVTPLNQVVQGWTEGIPLMNVGSKYKFYIPSNLAYGDAGGRMEPFKLLIFEVELLEINPTQGK